MAKRVLIELAQNGFAVRCGAQQSLVDAPLHLVATWPDLLELLDRYINESAPTSFGDRDSFPLLDALAPSGTALERRRISEAPTVRIKP